MNENQHRARTWFTDLAIGAVIAVVVVGTLWWLDRDDGSDPAATPSSSPQITASTVAVPTTKPIAFVPPIELDPDKTYTATIETTRGDIVIALDTKNAPIASAQFVKLARDGLYDGVVFGRVVDNFVIQAGDIAGTTSGAPVAGEIPTDGYSIGSVAAAIAEGEPKGTFDAQFFIVTGRIGKKLENEYARFGQVIEGQDVAKEIEDQALPDLEIAARLDQILKVSITES